MKKIYPSIMAADLLHLGDVIKKFNPICDGFHVDIMDNHFVPNLTFGAAFTNAIARASEKPIWVHLMVDKPEIWLHTLELMPGSTLTFHIENGLEIKSFAPHIREKKWRASVAINPKTPVEKILPVAHLVDQIVIMSVEPGFSGQDFIEDVVAKIDPLVALRATDKLNFTIAMDGGIDGHNIGLLARKGVDEFAAAKAIFGAIDPVTAYQELKRLT